jgi:ABC-type methionine transport system ATPase subunit
VSTAAKVRLTFPEALVGEPVIAMLALNHGVVANIRRANVEDDTGWIVCELSGTSAALDAAVSWLEATGVKVDWLEGQVES